MLKSLGGKSELIQGLECHLPPVGQVWNVLTGQLEKTGVFERSPRQKDQYWERQLPPVDWNDRRKAELRNGTIDPVCERYRRQEWYRRLNGFWFMNNGQPTYLTGLNYFFLSHWYLGGDVDYGYYRERDRKFFYFLQHEIEDPLSVGVLYVTRRREGKTSKGSCFVYEPVSRTPLAFGGIQSKTEEDAEKIVFQRGIVTPFTKMSDFFRPTFDTSSGKEPKKRLKFSSPAKKGRAAIDSFDDEELGSEIDFRASTIGAYDGSKLLRYLGDEIFKTANLNIRERHRIVRLCCTNERGQFSGKMLLTSSVEEIEGSIKDYRTFWEESNPLIRNSNGRTTTGLSRYFLSAAEALNYDQYGFEDVEANYAFYMGERDSVRHDINAYNSEVRKNPFSIEEAFRMSNDASIYDINRINDQLAAVAPLEEELIIEGELLWTNGQPTPNGPDTAVVFKEVKGGKFKLLRNQKFFKPDDPKFGLRKTQGLFVPINGARFALSCDPFDHVTTVDSRRSNGAAYLHLKFDSMDPDNSDLPILEYIYRADHPKLFYDDVLKICAFAGAPLLFEDNKQGIRTYFEERHFLPCLVHLPGRQQPGIPASVKSKQDLAETTKAYIIDSCHKVYFSRLLTDWRDFEYLNTKQYDAAMAYGWCLVSNKNYIFAGNPSANQEGTRNIDINKMFR
ncbi:MAG: hypothetical protein IPJ00_20475 [Saprospirales bacterium]|nr:hypothetical protein [Saprospirales bacterium]